MSEFIAQSPRRSVPNRWFSTEKPGEADYGGGSGGGGNNGGGGDNGNGGSGADNGGNEGGDRAGSNGNNGGGGNGGGGDKNGGGGASGGPNEYAGGNGAGNSYSPGFGADGTLGSIGPTTTAEAPTSVSAPERRSSNNQTGEGGTADGGAGGEDTELEGHSLLGGKNHDAERIRQTEQEKLSRKTAAGMGLDGSDGGGGGGGFDWWFLIKFLILLLIFILMVWLFLDQIKRKQ